MSRLPLLLILLIVGCPADEDPPPPPPGDTSVPWSGDLPVLADDIAHPRGFLPLRTAVHFHGPYSHDGCDSHIEESGEVDEECLQQLRDGLCRTHHDLAYLSDHPAYAAYQPFEDLLYIRGDDQPIEVDGVPVANRIICPDGHEVLFMVGIEDELMPLGLDRHAGAPVGAELDALYSSDGEALFAAVEAAGGFVWQEHPEERDLATLMERQDLGVRGLEIFQLHALMSPESREEIYGLDPFGWVEAFGPFMDEEGTGEPDLYFLAVHQELGPNVERWDALLARGAMTGVAVTDSHRNVAPIEMRDGERPDAHRRFLRWFSNHLLADHKSPEHGDELLIAGRLYVAFELLGTPDGLTLWYDDGAGGELELGGSCSGCTGGTLHLTCPTLSPSSPRDGEGTPEISAVVFRDGEAWQTGCGDFAVTEPGVYRARIDIVPHHLTGFLPEDPTPYLHEMPWVYTGVIRVGD